MAADAETGSIVLFGGGPSREACTDETWIFDPRDETGRRYPEPSTGQGGEMTFDALGELNWLAVIVAALAYFVLGAVWYAPPVLGKAWTAAAGQPMTGQSPNPAIYVAPAIGSLLSAIALGMIALTSGTDTLGEGIALGLVVGVGFAIAIAVITAVFETTKPKPMVWGAINAGYHFVGNLAAAVILALWD